MKIFRFIIIHLLMLFAAAMADIMLFGFMAFTVTCFAVAGVFSAVFCYAPWSEKETSDKNEMAALYRLMLVLSLCSLLFFLVAPLSGREYSLPVKSFAVTESLTATFLWKNKFITRIKNQ
jgi:hypothetical protein